jgi:hypothetical protein
MFDDDSICSEVRILELGAGGTTVVETCTNRWAVIASTAMLTHFPSR